MAGNRGKDWGKDKKFAEGQAEQVLDTLFFDFIDLAKKLQPKVVVAENVKGMLMGEAKQYVRKVYDEFQRAGYQLKVRPYLLNAATMGVPQRRERIFFVAIRNDLSNQFMEQLDMFQVAPKLDLEFNEDEIPYKYIRDTKGNESALGLPKMIRKYWLLCQAGNYFNTVHPKGSYFNEAKLHPDKVIPTIRSKGFPYDSAVERVLFDSEGCKAGTYPLDYVFSTRKAKYLIGMSVPPVMVAQIATRIYDQWLSKLKNN